ncbi:MAG: hypothetical protein ISS69_15955 [Phycisphaerae bacterium]|nr:hypothetical protein [Phycisphaerae bacterium]
MSVEGDVVHGQSAGKARGNRLRKSSSYWVSVGLPLCILLGIPITCALILPRVEDMREPVSAAERAEWIALVRKGAGLAELPTSATDVRIGRSGWDAGRVFVFRFGADPADIEAFLASSPVLAGSTPVVYSTEKTLALEIEEGVEESDYLPAGPSWPSWFDPWLRKAGRMYRRGPDAPYELNWIIVNDETHVVYAYMTWGL